MVRGSRLSLGCTSIFLKVVWGLTAVEIPCLRKILVAFSVRPSTNGIITSPFVFSLSAALVGFLACLFSILLLTCLKDHSGYPHRLSATLIFSSSSSLSSCSVTTRLFLSNNVRITPSLWWMGWWDVKFKYWSVWVSYLNYNGTHCICMGELSELQWHPLSVTCLRSSSDVISTREDATKWRSSEVGSSKSFLRKYSDREYETVKSKWSFGFEGRISLCLSQWNVFRVKEVIGLSDLYTPVQGPGSIQGIYYTFGLYFTTFGSLVSHLFRWRLYNNGFMINFCWLVGELTLKNSTFDKIEKIRDGFRDWPKNCDVPKKRGFCMSCFVDSCRRRLLNFVDLSTMKTLADTSPGFQTTNEILCQEQGSK